MTPEVLRRFNKCSALKGSGGRLGGGEDSGGDSNRSTAEREWQPDLDAAQGLRRRRSEERRLKRQVHHGWRVRLQAY